jgi:hypothetical protein
MRSLLAAVAVLAASAVISGCGAASETGASASLAPAGARALAEIDGNLDSDQWQAARELIDRFPDGGKLLDELPELEGAAGDKVIIVALNDSQGVVLTQPDDAAKLRSLVAEHHLVSRQIEGWTAVTDEADTLDAYERALDGGTLEGNVFYEAARQAFPEEALATLYARGDKGEWTALALTAEDDGFRLGGRMKTAAGGELQPIDPAALAEVPGDALAVIAFGGGDYASRLPDQFGLGALQLQPILDAFSGGAVIWVRPGMPIPEVTAILPNGSSALVDQLVQGFIGQTPEDTELDGQPARRLRAGPVTITYADVDGRLVLTTGTSLHGSGGLADDAGFQAAREKAGVTDPTSGFVYVDVQQLASLLSLLGGLDADAVPPELTRNLEHVDWLYAGFGGEGPEQEIAVFLAIR